MNRRNEQREKEAITRAIDPGYWRTWKPHPEHINALPDPVRHYVHWLETRADPSGDLQQIASLQDQVAALVRKCKELEEELKAGADHP